MVLYMQQKCAIVIISQGDRQVIRILGAANNINEADGGKQNSSWACKYILPWPANRLSCSLSIRPCFAFLKCG